MDIKQEREYLKQLEPLIAEGKPQDALNLIAAIEKQFPKSFQIKMVKAKALIQMSKNVSAEETLKALEKIHPDNLNLLHLMSTFYGAIGQKEKSLDCLNRILFVDPFNYEIKEKIDSLKLQIERQKLSIADTLPEVNIQETAQPGSGGAHVGAGRPKSTRPFVPDTQELEIEMAEAIDKEAQAHLPDEAEQIRIDPEKIDENAEIEMTAANEMGPALADPVAPASNTSTQTADPPLPDLGMPISDLKIDPSPDVGMGTVAKKEPANDTVEEAIFSGPSLSEQDQIDQIYAAESGNQVYEQSQQAGSVTHEPMASEAVPEVRETDIPASPPAPETKAVIDESMPLMPDPEWESVKVEPEVPEVNPFVEPSPASEPKTRKISVPEIPVPDRSESFSGTETDSKLITKAASFDASVDKPAEPELINDSESLDADDFNTMSAAEIYISQGLYKDALKVLDHLYRRDGNMEAYDRMVQLKKRIHTEKKIDALSQLLDNFKKRGM